MSPCPQDIQLCENKSVIQTNPPKLEPLELEQKQSLDMGKFYKFIITVLKSQTTKIDLGELQGWRQSAYEGVSLHFSVQHKINVAIT